MSSGVSVVSQLLTSWVRFTGATGVILNRRNVTSVTRNGAGDYQIVLDRELDANESIIFLGCEKAAPGLIGSYVHTTDASKQALFTSDAGAAADPTTVMFAIYQVAYGSGL